MKISPKSSHSIKTTLLIRTLFTFLLLAAFSFVAFPTRAGGAADKAKKAFADWKAAQAAVAAAQHELADAQKALQNAMAAVSKSGGKPTAAQEAALAQGRDAVARAEAALRAAEKQELAARVELEAAIAELPDGPLKDQLKRERNFPSLVTANGLHTVMFDTPSGQLTVNLPDDMMAGDTISGTVIAEPKGQTKEERARNQSSLQGMVIEIDGKQTQYSPPVIEEAEKGIMASFSISPTNEPRVTPTAALSSGPLPIALVNSAGKVVAQTTIPTAVMSGTSFSGFPNNFNIPTLGQTGRPIEIIGPFDGNSANTTITAVTQRGSGNDFEKSTESPSGRFGLLAESPRKAVFSSPPNVTGPIQITVNEGNKQTTATYRNVGVDLTAPKTNLRRGESTELRVEVSGLQGINEPVPLTLDSRGVITMEGGTHQPLVIQPSQVGADGRYSTTRGITGVQAGGWSATATVVTNRAMGTGGSMLAKPSYPNEQEMDGINSVEDLKKALGKQGLQKGDEATCQRLMDTKVALCTRYKESTDAVTKAYLEKKYQLVRQVLVDYSCGQTLPATLGDCP